VGTEEIYDVAGDVFAPSALGAVINEETIPR
jgi:glutamate dehydrogenase/leucine dehydrogenase